MQAVAGKLHDDDIAAVAAHFASLPAPKRQGAK
jgi:cytochrome c553